MATQTAGPFLRYGNIEPGSDTWTGSCLFLTSSGTSTPQNGSAYGNGLSGKAGSSPTLTIEDSQGPQGGNSNTIQPTLLDTVYDWSFWRFDLSLKLGPTQRPVRYAVEYSPSGEKKTATFWLAAIGQPFHWGYYSCNGMSGDVAEDSFARKDPTYLWRDLLQVHSAFPMHCLVGGGDQVYSDPVWKECEELKAWSNLESEQAKIDAPWTPSLTDSTTQFYLKNYIENFTMPHVSTAYASIPTVMVWDDHDIWDGYGSYDVELQDSPVFKGLFEVAKRFYLLFQQHTTSARHATDAKEYINIDDGYHSLKYMGPQVAVLAVDMRTKRTKKDILPESSYQLLRNAAMDLPESVSQLVILSGVPLIFPSIPGSEAILGGMKAMVTKFAVVRNFGKSLNIIDRFGQPEILDDLLDGWAAKVHKEERVKFIKLLQEIALTKKVRVSILSGDAHVGGVGRLYSRPKKSDLADDPLFMPQIISSAIMNAPPPPAVVKMLMQTNFAHNIDGHTRQKMVRAFWPRHPRTDKLLRHRNWCDISMMMPPYAPPGNPQDAAFGGLRYSLRVENPDKWVGHAEEVFDIVVPRFPGDTKSVPSGNLTVAGAPVGPVMAEKLGTEQTTMATTTVVSPI